MKVAEFLWAALLWQSALLVNIGTAAAPEHLRFQRAVELPAGAGGLACATLDAALLAHTASGAHNDIRIYRETPGSPAQTETPYSLTESGPEPVADAEAVVVNAGRSGNALHFDLRMPTRPYSEVQLRLRAHDFIGTAVVTANDAHGVRRDLGTFGIFDLSREGLGSWTVLPMAETDAPVLHVEVSLRTPDGLPVKGIPPALIAGASVPPSRERQTVFTPVAATATTVQQGSVTAALIEVPAHVPVERIRFELPDDFDENYFREVIVRARAAGEPAAETEVMDAGALQHVRWPAGDVRLNPIDVTLDSVNATIGATLASAAAVRVMVENGAAPPLPLRRVILEMRERKVCFVASPGAGYTVRYGDPALAAPVYDGMALMEAKRPALSVALGPEQRNPAWRPRSDQRTYLDRHPEVFWLVVLACCGMMGGSALHYVQHRGGVRG